MPGSSPAAATGGLHVREHDGPVRRAGMRALQCDVVGRAGLRKKLNVRELTEPGRRDLESAAELSGGHGAGGANSTPNSGANSTAACPALFPASTSAEIRGHSFLAASGRRRM